MNTTTVAIDLYGLARVTVQAYLKTSEEGTRPIDQRLAEARFQGVISAISALRLAPTPFAVELALSGAIGQADEPRPAWRPIHNADRQVWDAAAVTRFAAILGWGIS